MSVPIKRYRVVLIEEGLGNLNSCFYYTREALQYAADNDVFEGKKAYANHPDAIEEKTLPERSIRDIIGYYQNVDVTDGRAGQALLEADLCIPVSPDMEWAHLLVQTSLDTAGQFDGDFVGLSINAAGASSNISLESFMSENTLPISAMPKLLKAKSEGITEIEVCSKLMEAVSCDLVTEAGAGGRIIKILESERKRMGKKVNAGKFTNKKIKQADPGAGDDDAVDPSQDSSHEDLQQDIELIKSLLAEYCGSETPTEEECQAMGAALGNAKEMGLKGKEAEETAGHAMKMAKHVASKQAAEAEEAESEEADPDAPAAPAKKAPAAPGKKAPPAAAAGAGDEDDTDTDPQEAKMESRILRLEGDNLKIMEENKALKLEKTTEKLISESGLPKHAQKKLRESVGVVKSEKELTDKVKLFKEAFNAASADTLSFNPEKTGGDSTSGFSFADCVQTND